MTLAEKSGWCSKKYGIIVIIFLILLGIYFLQSYFNHQAKDQQKIYPSVTLGTSLSLNTALLTIAKEKGFFEKEGLDVRIRLYKSGGPAFDDMLAGNIEMAGLAETPIVHRSFESGGFKIIATALTTSNDPKIVTIKGSGINKPADLTGKSIGVTKKYQSAHFFLHMFLLKHNIQKSDVSITHNSPSAIVDQLNAGTIDAAALFEPYVSYAADKLGDKALIFSEPGIYTKTFNLVSNTDFLKNNPELLQKFLSALIQAEKYIYQHLPETIELVSNGLALDKIIVEKYFEYSSLEISLPQALLVSMRDQAQWIASENKTSRLAIPDFKDFIYFDALNAVHPTKISIDTITSQ
jgi:ABC-type nitrate/sulfonate/bicarbonate transport system substrate-binding protein